MDVHAATGKSLLTWTKGVLCGLLVLVLLVLAPAPVSAQDVAADDDLQAQIGLFSAWLDGQISYVA